MYHSRYISQCTNVPLNCGQFHKRIHKHRLSKFYRSVSALFSHLHNLCSAKNISDFLKSLRGKPKLHSYLNHDTYVNLKALSVC